MIQHSPHLSVRQVQLVRHRLQPAGNDLGLHAVDDGRRLRFHHGPRARNGHAESEDDDDHETYLIGSIEERHEEHEVISPTSPLGAALLGAAVEETVSFQAPSGTLEVTIVAIGV
mgnify:CR=1 FL=1